MLLIAYIAEGQQWQTDMAAAMRMAAEQQRPLIMVFQGSDWCAPCMRLERQLWRTDTFRTYAEEHYVLLRVDFPRRKKNKLSAQRQAHNDSLAARYNPQAIFPLLLIFDAQGRQKGITGYKKMKAEAYIEHLNSFLIQQD